MLLTELLSDRTIALRLSATDKVTLIDRMIDLLQGHPAIRSIEEVRRVVHERERLMSTGVGKGVAIPHGKTPAVTRNVAVLAVTSTPIDFDALDGEAVNLVFLLVGPTTAQSAHIKLLSRISRLMSRADVRLRLMGAGTEVEALVVIRESEMELLED